MPDHPERVIVLESLAHQTGPEYDVDPNMSIREARRAINSRNPKLGNAVWVLTQATGRVIGEPR